MECFLSKSSLHIKERLRKCTSNLYINMWSSSKTKQVVELTKLEQQTKSTHRGTSLDFLDRRSQKSQPAWKTQAWLSTAFEIIKNSYYFTMEKSEMSTWRLCTKRTRTCQVTSSLKNGKSSSPWISHMFNFSQWISACAHNPCTWSPMLHSGRQIEKWIEKLDEVRVCYNCIHSVLLSTCTQGSDLFSLSGRASCWCQRCLAKWSVGRRSAWQDWTMGVACIYQYLTIGLWCIESFLACVQKHYCLSEIRHA